MNPSEDDPGMMHPNQPGNRELFFEMSLDLHCIASPEAKLLHINKRWERLLGYTRSELLSGSFLDLIHPDDIGGTVAAMEDLNTGKPVVNFSNRYRTKSGEYRVLDWNALFNERENLYYATARDVTEQQAAAQRLQSTNRILSCLNGAHELYMASGMSPAWWDKMLADVLELTESEYGFIGAVEEDATGRYLRTFAITDISWDETTKKFFESGREEGLEFRNLKTLFGQVILTEKHVIANEVSTDPRAAGRPPGHPPLDRFLGIALHGSGGLKGMIGVANRMMPYDQRLIDDLHPVINFLGTLIESHVRKRREQSTDARFRELLALNTQILESSTSFIFAMDLAATCLQANRATRKLFDVTDDRHALHFVSLQLLRQNHEWFEMQKDRVRAEGSVTIELELLSARDGSLPCEFTLTGLISPEGDLQGILFVGFELTTRKSLEASAIETAALLSRVDVLRKRQSEDELISSCVEYLLNCNSLNETHQIVYQHLRQLYPEAVVEVFAFDAEAEVLELQWPKSEEVPPLFPASECWAMRSRRLHSWWSGSSGMQCTHTAEQPYSMIACAPLRSYDSVFGMLSVYFPEKTDASDESLTSLFESREKRIAEISQRLSVALATVELKVRLERAALTDALTDVSNRRAFEQSVIRSIARARRHKLQFSIIVLDIDYFKTVNDQFGHDAGDRVLKGIAAVMKEMIRTSDELGRLGGEEFALLLEGASEDEAVVKAEGIRAAIEAAELLPGKTVTASFGVVHSSQVEGASWKQLYHAADRALYKAKQAGRNRVVLASD